MYLAYFLCIYLYSYIRGGRTFLCVCVFVVEDGQEVGLWADECAAGRLIRLRAGEDALL